MKNEIIPSFLSAPFYCLNEVVQRLEEAGVKTFHYDVMDGHFVPNLTVGPIIIKSFENRLRGQFDVHLMVTNPEIQIEWFDFPTVRSITIHIETSKNMDHNLQKIRKLGKQTGMTLNPPTDQLLLEPFLEQVDRVLVMLVHPGFGGQTLIMDMLPRVEYFAKRRDELGLNYIIQVDGGINKDTIRLARDAGADEIVSGNAIFCEKDYVQAYNDLYQTLKM